MLKKCKKCGFEKSLDNFSLDKNKKDNHQNYCKVCKTSMYKRVYPRDRDKYKQRNKLKLSYKNDIKDNVKKDKGGKCIKCGENRLYVLDFHHLDPSQKTLDLSTLIGHVGNNNPLIKEEADKCILLCANCHREFHYLEKKENISIKNYIAR